MFVTREWLHVKWPTMKRTNTGLLDGAVCPCRHSRCCSRAPLDGLDGNPSVNTVDGQTRSTNGKHVEEIGGEGGAPVVGLLHLAALEQLEIDCDGVGQVGKLVPASRRRNLACRPRVGLQSSRRAAETKTILWGICSKYPYAAALATGWSSLPRYSDAGCCPAALVVPVPPSGVPAERSQRLLRVGWVGKQEKAKNPPGRDLTLADLLSLRERLFPSLRFVIQRIESATPWPAGRLGPRPGPDLLQEELASGLRRSASRRTGRTEP